MCYAVNLMTLKSCFSDRLRFPLCIIPAYYLLFKQESNYSRGKLNPNMSDACAAMRTLQLYGLGMGDIVFQFTEILNDQSLKCLRQSKITELQRSAFELCVSVNEYCTVILHQKLISK